MSVSLDTIKRELAEAELDEGLFVFGRLLLSASLLLAFAVNLPVNWRLSLIVLGLLAIVIVGGSWLQQIRRRRTRQRLEQRFSLPYQVLERCAELHAIDLEIKQVVRESLNVCTAIEDIGRHEAWTRCQVSVEPHLETVHEGLLELLRRAQTAQEIKNLFDRCQDRVNRPELLEGLRQRYEAKQQELQRIEAALEQVLTCLAEALAAALDEGGRVRELEARLQEFAASMDTLTRSLDEAAEMLESPVSERLTAAVEEATVEVKRE
ncbi:MAG TPA: hypothetical protein EYP85_04560 [Armatimonadetes bacterium]|nr:hypothetical protein [Armatimonadota bacterium]